MDNAVTLVGNMTRDPEALVTASQMTIAKFGLAVNTRRNVNGEWVDEPNFFDVDCFSDLAMNVIDTLHKGDRVIISGRIKYSAWENADGEKRSKVTIVADECGPSLRWAVCPKILKTKGGSGSDPNGRVDAARKALADAKVAYAPGEEPF